MVYCRSDTAFLCLSCDRNVHSANALSKRHSRTLVCERCNAQPALVRCIDEEVSLCQKCNWEGHDEKTSFHKQQSIDYYTGCPSASELSKIWSFILDIPLPSSDNSTCQEGLGLLSISESGTKNCMDHVDKNDNQAAVADGNDLNESIFWSGRASSPELRLRECPDQPGCTESSQVITTSAFFGLVIWIGKLSSYGLTKHPVVASFLVIVFLMQQHPFLVRTCLRIL